MPWGLLVSLFAGFSVGAPPRRFDLGFWCGVPHAFLSQERIDQMGAAGFTLGTSSCNEPNNITYNQKALAFANKTGIKLYVFDDRATAAAHGVDVDKNVAALVADYGSLPAMFAYALVDEPTAPFPTIAAAVSAIRARDAAHYGYVNLLPNYASEGQLGTKTYEEYVSTFINQVKPSGFSYDNYPFYTSSDNSMYFDNLQVVGSLTAAAGIPWWQYIQAISWSGMRATTEAEKMWQGMMTIAYGGSGFCYFTYWTPSGEWGTGLIDPNGNPTAQYAQATRINKVALAIGRRTVQGSWKGAFHNGGLPPNTAPLPGFAPVYIPSTAPVVVGLFALDNGDMLALFVNRDHDNAVTTSVYTASADGQPLILDPVADKFSPWPVQQGLSQLSLAAGGGALVQLKGPVPKGPGGPPVYVGVVRNNEGTFVVVDKHFGTQALGAQGWNFCPQDYHQFADDFTSNGFWLCARSDLVGHTFYVGNVVADQGEMFRVSSAGTVSQGSAGWNQCPQGALLGTYFNSNGFWVCMV